MTRLLLLSGSQRRLSYNSRLIGYLGEALQDKCQIDLIDPSEIDLPLFNQDLETNPLLQKKVAAIHQRFLLSDGMIIACPEYNGQMTPYLKNLVDWVSRLAYILPDFDNPFIDRPTLLCSASTGWTGGAVGIPHARALFGYVGCCVLGGAITVSHVDQLWTDFGFVFDPSFESHIQDTCQRLLKLVQARKVEN